MRILITGGMGWIGGRAVAELVDRGHDVVSYDVRAGDDIFDQPRLQDDMNGCEAVVHLAAIPHPKPQHTWEDYWRTNVCGTQIVARAALLAGVSRFVYSSSTAYYGLQRSFPFQARMVVENAPNALQRFLDQEMPGMAPYNRAALCYICSKIAAEAVLAAYGYADELSVRILRLAPVTRNQEPWAWGLLTDIDRAAVAIADAVEMDADYSYIVRNVANPDVELVQSLYEEK